MAIYTNRLKVPYTLLSSLLLSEELSNLLLSISCLEVLQMFSG